MTVYKFACQSFLMNEKSFHLKLYTVAEIM